MVALVPSLVTLRKSSGLVLLSPRPALWIVTEVALFASRVLSTLIITPASSPSCCAAVLYLRKQSATLSRNDGSLTTLTRLPQGPRPSFEPPLSLPEGCVSPVSLPAPHG